MTTPNALTTNENLQALIDSVWITTDTKFEDDLSGYKWFEFDTFEKFDAAQQTCSGSKLLPTYEGCVEFLYDRHRDLNDEALNNDEYHLPMGYCESGIYNYDGGWISWYESTSGTIFLVRGAVNGDVLFYSALPESRIGGSITGK